MNKNIQLSIKEPCQADWNKMTPNKEGKHCSLCDKTVVDFTRMSPEEIRIYFQNAAGKKVCGNLFVHQLDHKKKNFQSVFSDLYHTIHFRISNNFLRSVALFFVGVGLFITGCRTRYQGDINSYPCDDPRYMKGNTKADSVRSEPVDTLRKEK